VVKIERRQKFLPTRRGVTFLAALLERALVRVDMAVSASLELHVLVAGRPARHIWLVTLFAFHLNV